MRVSQVQVPPLLPINSSGRQSCLPLFFGCRDRIVTDRPKGQAPHEHAKELKCVYRLLILLVGCPRRSHIRLQNEPTGLSALQWVGVRSSPHPSTLHRASEIVCSSGFSRFFSSVYRQRRDNERFNPKPVAPPSAMRGMRPSLSMCRGGSERRPRQSAGHGFCFALFAYESFYPLK
jgi:hypothetical protein